MEESGNISESESMGSGRGWGWGWGRWAKAAAGCWLQLGSPSCWSLALAAPESSLPGPAPRAPLGSLSWWPCSVRAQGPSTQQVCSMQVELGATGVLWPVGGTQGTKDHSDSTSGLWGRGPPLRVQAREPATSRWTRRKQLDRHGHKDMHAGADRHTDAERTTHRPLGHTHSGQRHTQGDRHP